MICRECGYDLPTHDAACPRLAGDVPALDDFELAESNEPGMDGAL